MSASLRIVGHEDTVPSIAAGDGALPDAPARHEALPGALPGAPSGALRVDFTASGDSHAFRGEGWSGQERDAVWTLGACSTMRLPPPPDGQKLILELDINPALCLPVVRAQMLTVRVNGQTLGWQRVTGPTRLRCRIGPGLCQPGEPIDVAFEHPGFLRLDLLGKGGDDRALAIRFFGLRLYPVALGIAIDRLMPLRPGLERRDLYPPPAPPAAHATPPAERVIHQFGPSEREIGASGRDCLLDGWHIDAEGLVWSVATTCHLDLPMPSGPGPHNLRLGLSPLLVREVLPSQRMAVIVDGLLLGQFRLHGETALSIALPAGLDDGRPSLVLALVFPDAMPLRGFANGDPDHVLGIVLDWIAVEAVPTHLQTAVALRGDGLDRARPVLVSAQFLDIPQVSMPITVKKQLNIDLIELMRGFESLGDNCAFGMSQRRAGTEVLGLLRFANTPLRSLLRGLTDQFSATTKDSEIKIYLHPAEPREYMLHIPRYGIHWHTSIYENDTPFDSVAHEQKLKLKFLRRKFIGGLEAGRKIYVLVRTAPNQIEVVMPGWGAPFMAADTTGPLNIYPVWDAPRVYDVAPGPLSLGEVLPVFLEINRYHRNTLIYIVRSTDRDRAGTVELLAPGLMRGYVTDLTLRGYETPNDVDWLHVAANAWLLNQTTNAAFRECVSA
jgi:hypothetical protein